MRHNITCIPIHDSFIVQTRHKNDLEIAMREAFQSVFSKIIPEIKQADLIPSLNAIRNELLVSADEMAEAAGPFWNYNLKPSEFIASIPHASFHRASHKLIDKDFIKKKEDFGRAHYFLLGFQFSEITK